MDQRDAVVCAAVLQQGSLISQRDLKLAFRFIVRNGIAIHKTYYSIEADSTPTPLRGNRLFFRYALDLFGFQRAITCLVPTVRLVP